MSWAALRRASRTRHLDIFAALHPGPGGSAATGCETLLLLGPHEPGFWAHVTAQPEFHDPAPEPLDRWSKRVIGGLADQLGGQAHFPSDGPPYPPFTGWARASGWIWTSPVGLLVHATAGLFVSLRGAVALPWRVMLPAPARNPCTNCADQPCTTACPVGALSKRRYDVAACHAHLSRPEAKACRDQGCAARRACPVSQTYGRLAAQSAFHMKAFHPE